MAGQLTSIHVFRKIVARNVAEKMEKKNHFTTVEHAKQKIS